MTAASFARLALLGLLLTTAGAAPRADPPGSRGALTPGTFAITNVNVVPMTRDTVVRGATVLVRDGIVVAVGPRVQVPSGARRIDGRGRYLMPGLADMHTHLFSDENTPDSLAARELGVMLANGVTATRLMIGTPEHLALRRDIEAGRVLGPQLWIASPQFAGRPDVNASVVRTPDSARAAVRAARQAGYDFIKLTLHITPEVFDAVVAEAAAQRLPVIGHVDARVGARRALAAGQHIEHLDNYMESVLHDDAPMQTSVSDVAIFRPQNWESLDYVDDAKVEEVARATAASGTYTTPTLNMFRHALATERSEAEIQAQPEWLLMPRAHREGYLRAHRRYWGTPPNEVRRARYIGVRNRLVAAIQAAGGKIMAGSDTPGWLFGYGFALHRELETLVGAGLTPYEALAAATRTPAAFTGAEAAWGTIAPGRRADFVLVAGNPLEDIRHTARIEAVAIGGRWLDRPALDAMLAAARVIGE